jgi:hypothetical protein
MSDLVAIAHNGRAISVVGAAQPPMSLGYRLRIFRLFGRRHGRRRKSPASACPSPRRGSAKGGDDGGGGAGLGRGRRLAADELGRRH